jgi:hypothetical protein
MALPGLVRANNLNDVVDRERAWDNLGNGISATISGNPVVFTITGRDILALNAVRNVSTRNFIFIKGLLSAAQPRLATAAALASLAISNQDASLLKASPTSSGNFFIDRGGIVASGLQINGTNIASLSSSAFSGSTALFPVVVSSLKLSSGLRWTPAMTAGTINSPDKAIPIETSEFILFAKAGQS